MHGVTADGVLWALTIVTQAALAALVIKKGMSRNYPILLTYLVFNLLEDPLAWIMFQGPKEPYFRFYFVVTILDYVLQLFLIAEIGRNVLSPSRTSLPFRLWPIATGILLVCAIIAAIFSPKSEGGGLNAATQVFSSITLGLAVLKLLLFASLAGFAQLLGIGWKSRVLQLASGLAFYGACSLFIQLAISHIRSVDPKTYDAHFVPLTELQSAAYLGTLLFWTWAFSRNEAPRKEFTPQMQQVLVTIAQSAKRTRVAVTRSTDRR
jgi:hypothetical protein